MKKVVVMLLPSLSSGNRPNLLLLLKEFILNYPLKFHHTHWISFSLFADEMPMSRSLSQHVCSHRLSLPSSSPTPSSKPLVS